MPETNPTPAAPQAPQVARPPFTGAEQFPAFRAYAIAKLTTLTGNLPDGSPRWIAVPQTSQRICHVPSGLTLRVDRTENGVAPYKVTINASALHVASVRGNPDKDVVVKVHANGEARWETLATAAALYTIRKTEGAEAVRLANARVDAAWSAMAEYAKAEAAKVCAAFPGFPTPQEVNPLARDSHNPWWEWVLTVREETPPVHFVVEFTVSPRGGGFVAPADTDVRVRLGFGRYATGQNMPLCEAFRLLHGQAAGYMAMRAALAPAPAFVDLTDPRLTPGEGSSDSSPASA